MIQLGEKRRALLAANAEIHAAARALFIQEPLGAWDILEADGFSRARFVQQHNPCDVLLVHDELFEREGGQGMSWLAWQREMPVVFLAGDSADRMARAYRFGAGVCVPWNLACSHPQLLSTTMERAMEGADLQARLQQTKKQLRDTQLHVDRLVNLIWRMSPKRVDCQWFPQRYMLERLQEELVRAERHHLPLSLAIGELEPPKTEDGEPALLPEQMMEIIVRGKRRSDVAGQYGVNGFMLLMVHTSKEGGVQCCRRLQKIIEHTPSTTPEPHDTFRTYFGIAAKTDDKNTPLSLLRCAEEGLEAARAKPSERIAAAS